MVEKPRLKYVAATDFEARPAEMLQEIAQSGETIVLVRDGEAIGVVMLPAEFERVFETTRVLTKIGKSLLDAAAGRYVDHETVMKDARARARDPGRQSGSPSGHESASAQS